MTQPYGRGYSRVVTFRLTEKELNILAQNASLLGVSSSGYLRALIALPIEVIDVAEGVLGKGQIDGLASSRRFASSVLVFDKATFRQLLMQLRQWGYHLDHALHALNTIAAKEFMRPEDTERIVLAAVESIARVADMRAEIEAHLCAIKDSHTVRIGR